MQEKVIVYDTNGEGHRANYVNFLSDQLDAEPLTMGWFNALPKILTRKVVLFSTFESAPAIITLIVLFRSILFRKSRIIVLRPLITNGRFSAMVKKLIHLLLSVIPGCRLIVLIDLKKSSHLYNRSFFLADPEYWDVSSRDRNKKTALSAGISSTAAGQKILICAGSITPDRGIEYLAEIVHHPDWGSLNILVVVAGRIAKSLPEIAQKMRKAGCIVEDRYLSDDELFSLFAIATYSWCCYHPTRDMTSGIFGRSCQFDVWPVMREGSLLAIAAKNNNYGTAIPWEEVVPTMQRLKSMKVKPISNNVDPVEQSRILNYIVYG